MKGRASYLLYGILLLAVAWWLSTQLGGEKRQIEKRLGRLAELVEKDGNENDLTSANKARNVGLLFARDFTIDLQGRARGVVSDRARVSQVMLQYRRLANDIGVTFRDIEIELGPGERSADMTAMAVTSSSTDGQPSRRRFRVAFHWIKEDNEWVIQRAELVEELEPGIF